MSARRPARTKKPSTTKPRVPKRIRRRAADPDLDIAQLLGGVAGRIPKSKFKDISSYFKAMTKDPWLAIGQIRVTKMLMMSDWRIVNEQTKEALPEGRDDAPRVVQLIKKPNSWYSFSSYLNRLMIHRNIGGTVFQYRRPSVATTERGETVPESLWLLEPQRVEIVPPDPDSEDEGFYGGFKYRNGAKKLEIPAQDVDVLKFAEHPTDLYWGMGVVELGESHFNITISMEEWIWSLFTNGIIPDGIITLPGKVSQEVFERYMKQLQQRFMGNKNRHKPLVLEQGGKYERTTTPEEADFETSRKGRRDATLALQGVSPIRAGLTENLNYASAYISDAAFIRDTYLPTTRDLETFFTENVTYRFGPYKLEFEKQMALGDPTAVNSRAQIGFSSGAMSPNDVRELFGLERKDPKQYPALEQHYLGFGVMAITGEGAEVPTEPPPEATPGTPPAEQPTSTETPEVKPPFPELLEEQKRSTAFQRRILRFIVVERRRVESAIRRVAKRFFKWQMEQMIARLLKDTRSVAERTIADLFDDAADIVAWQGTARRFFSGALQEEFTAMADLLGYTPDEAHRFEAGSPLFEQKIDRLAQAVTDVTSVTRDKINDVIQQGIREGRSVAELARGSADGTYPGIEGTFNEMTPWRSQLIARTESSRAMDQAATQVYKGLGVTMVDVIGCEDDIIMQGQKYGCNSQNIPIAEAEKIKFHPNHKGAIVPQTPVKGWGMAQARALTTPDRRWDHSNSRLERLAEDAPLPTPALIGAKAT